MTLRRPVLMTKKSGGRSEDGLRQQKRARSKEKQGERVSRSGISQKRSHYDFVTDGPTDTASSRVASPRLTNKQKKKTMEDKSDNGKQGWIHGKTVADG